MNNESLDRTDCNPAGSCVIYHIMLYFVVVFLSMPSSVTHKSIFYSDATANSMKSSVCDALRSLGHMKSFVGMMRLFGSWQR